MTLAEKIACLSQGYALYIEFNDHRIYHQAIEDAIAEIIYHAGDDEDFVSPEEINECIRTKSLWKVQWYYRTAVGCYVVYASTLERALDNLLETEEAKTHLQNSCR
jgi:hypothetical protein